MKPKPLKRIKDKIVVVPYIDDDGVGYFVESEQKGTLLNVKRKVL